MLKTTWDKSSTKLGTTSKGSTTQLVSIKDGRAIDMSSVKQNRAIKRLGSGSGEVDKLGVINANITKITISAKSKDLV